MLNGIDSLFDVGSDFISGWTYLTGTIYIKHVDSLDHPFVTMPDSNCTMTQRLPDGDYEFECFEKDIVWGLVTLAQSWKLIYTINPIWPRGLMGWWWRGVDLPPSRTNGYTPIFFCLIPFIRYSLQTMEQILRNATSVTAQIQPQQKRLDICELY